jgi:hypothetical protein
MASLMDLPAEVRNSIYNELFSNLVTDVDFSLLTASKLINEEAASYFYQHNAFTVSLPIRTCACKILSPIPNRYLKHIRRFTIDVCLITSRTMVDDCARRIAALADSGATFSTLTLSFRSTTSRMLSNRVDDPVLHAEHPITLALRHILSSNIARSVRIVLDDVWFAPGVASQLAYDSQGSLEVVTSASSTERPLLGQTTQDHLRNLGLEVQDVHDAEYLLPSLSDGSLSSMPSPLSSALSEVDAFSPTEFMDEARDEGAENVHDPSKNQNADSLFDEPLFDTDEDELNEEDDVGDEDMEDIDDIDAILGNMEETMHYCANEADVCYMTNFAPDLLRRWLEDFA